MNLDSMRPLGDATTVIDLADRDEMDDDMFPLSSEKSWFTRDTSRRYLNFTPCIQEFVYKGTAEFGNRLVFELGSVKSCDLLFVVALQLRLGHWFPPDIVERIQSGLLTYQTPADSWFYANNLGAAVIAKAEFLLEDQTLETVDGDFSNLFALLFSDINTQFGPGIDAQGRASIQELIDWKPYNVFPTSNGIISCILPFSFTRIRLRNGFPLSSVKEGTIRVAITLRPFSECIRIRKGFRATCNETPLGKTFLFDKHGPGGPGTLSVTASSDVPQFADARLVTYGVLVDGKLRNALLKAPFDRLFREVQAFRFDEPKKYVVNTPSNGTVRLQFPIEINGPIEEIIWFIRRKAVSNNNEWMNYSNRVEDELNDTYSHIYRPQQSMLVSATLQVNGIDLVQEDGEYFRRQIAQRHRGGIVAYNNFVYGYVFAQNPGRQNPNGWMNASRSQDVRIRMDIKPPPPLDPNISIDLEFEVAIYSISLNWVRFENGIANKVFSS